MTDTIQLRPATLADADGMAAVQNAIFWARFPEPPYPRARAISPGEMRRNYLEHPHRLATTLALRNGEVLGFQWLGRAWPDNEYGVTPGWGVIGTHIDPGAGRSGIGRQLFAATLTAARQAGLAHIDASIGADNAPALAYYAAMGFRPYRRSEGRIPHRYDL